MVHENHACGGLNALVMKYSLPYKYMSCIAWFSYTFDLACGSLVSHAACIGRLGGIGC